jgi:hypothetical protein
MVAWFEPVPIRPDPEIVAVKDSETEVPAAFFCVTTITAAASEDTVFGANTVASAVAVIVSPELIIDVDFAADAFTSAALTITDHRTADEFNDPPPPFTVGVNLITYVPATLGATRLKFNLADTAVRLLVVDEISATYLSADTVTTALVVSFTERTANCAAPEGKLTTEDVNVIVSPEFAAKNDTDATAVAVSPAIIVVEFVSSDKVSALCAALDGSADNAPNVNAETVAIAIRFSLDISLNELIYFFLLFIHLL